MSGRRALFGAAAALVVTPAAMASLSNPDAELIARCTAYIEAVIAYDGHGGETENEDDDPFWHRLTAARTALRGMRATTLAGVEAKARVAMHLAHQPSGRHDFDTGFVLDWPEQVVRDLLAIQGAA
ncbi:MAG: hypothetical protein ACRYGM_05290 [Janthinobacterium lividum]